MIVPFIAGILLIFVGVFCFIQGIKMDDTGYSDVSPILIGFGTTWLIIGVIMAITFGTVIFL